MLRLLQAVCRRIGVDVADRLELNSKKHKYLVKSISDQDVSSLPSLPQLLSRVSCDILEFILGYHTCCHID